MSSSVLLLETVTRRIYAIRGQRVILDSDLAELYGVPTKRLNEQVRRNLDRFPADFLFQLDEEEFAALRSQFATSKLRAHPRSIGTGNPAENGPDCA